MKNILKIMIALQIMFCFTSCDFLDTVPTDLTPATYFNTPDDVNSFLTSAYAPLMSEHFYGNNFPLKIAGEDLGYYARSTNGESIVCAVASASDSYIFRFWRVLYDGINRTNMLLENIDRVAFANTVAGMAEKERYIGEARALRAFYYFTLVQNFGDVPLRTKSPDDVNNLMAPRADKQTVYNYIISEMIAAEPFLSDFNTNVAGRITKSAAQGLLARIYLFRAGERFRSETEAPDPNASAYFSEAAIWAKKVIDSNKHTLITPYSRVFIDLAQDKYNNESIWEAEEAGNRLTPEQSAGRIGNVIGLGGPSDYPNSTEVGLANPGYGYNFIKTTQKLYEMYEVAKDTARANWNISTFVYTKNADGSMKGRKYYYGKMPSNLTGATWPITSNGFVYEMSTTKSDTLNTARVFAKYRREYEVVTPKNKNYTPINFPILRYSDVLLMYAEALNESSVTPPAEAIAAFDRVRARAGIATIASSNPNISKDDFRNMIKNERAMELCYESTRRYDLIRWGDYLTAMNAVGNSIPGSIRVPSSEKYGAAYFKIPKAYLYLPIPPLEIAVNSMIVGNNPGW